jgi:hypothetical protein
MSTNAIFNKLHRWHTERLRKKDNLLTGETGKRGVGGAKSYYGEESLILYASFNAL